MKLSSRSIALLLAGAVLLGALAAGGLYTWRSYAMAVQEERSYVNAQKLLARSRPQDALSIIRMMKGVVTEDYIRKWMPLEIQALEQSRNINRLVYLYGQYPREVLRQEKASLLVGRTLMATGNQDLFAGVRNAWRGREKSPELWFALDVDALLREGRTDEAARILGERSFPGARDSGRLTRLAMLASATDMDQAWDLLDKAFRADPRNSDVRSFRAQILESRGNLPAARVEYVAALLSEPGNPLLRDQLAEFYRRQGSHGLAMQTWKEGLGPDSPDFLWIKALFWSKVALPGDLPVYQSPPLPDETAPLVRILQGLKAPMFWDGRAVQEEMSIQKVCDARQEVFWLKLIQALRDGSESRASEMLKNNPFRRASFDPDLERALQTILVYRRWGVLVAPGTGPSAPAHARRLKHQLFETMEKLAGKDAGAVPPDLDALLKCPEAFSAAFLAAGWLEAAIETGTLKAVPEGRPDWLAYGFTQALRYTRGSRPALEYADRQRPSPALELLKAELLLADSQVNKAVPRLQALSGSGSDVGFRAAWLLGLTLLDKGDLEGSKRTVESNAALSRSTAGKEILARIALNRGDAAEADRIYGLVARESYEARAYLARRAFAAKDYAKARGYTEDLVRGFPDTLEFRENLARISRAEHGN